MRTIHTVRRLIAPSLRRAALGCLFLSALTALTAAAAEPRPSPHRFIPAKGLIAFVEFDGLDAHVDAWKATSAYGLLVKTPAGSMMTEMAKQVLDQLFKSVLDGKVTGADLIALHEHFMHRGFVVAIHEGKTSAGDGTIVLNGVGAKPIRERFDRLLQLALGSGVGGKLPAPVRFRGRDVYHDPVDAQKQPDNQLAVFAPPLEGAAAPAAPSCPSLWWFYEGDDLVLVEGPDDEVAALLDPAKKKAPDAVRRVRLSAVVDAIEGKQPNVETHAAYISAVAEGKDIKGFEPDGLFFIAPGNNKGLFAQFSGSADVLAQLGARAGSLPIAGFGSPASAPSAPAGLFLPTPLSGAGDAVSLPGPPGVPPATAIAIAPTELPPLYTTDLPPLTEELALPAPTDAKAEEQASKPTPAGPADASKPAPPRKTEPADVAKQQSDPLEVLGLDGIKRIVGRWGFEGKALVTDVRIEAPAPRKGIVAWIDQPAFRKDRLPPIPRGTGAFAVDSFDPGGGYQKIVDGIKALEPELGGEIDKLEQAIREATGLRLREDLLKHLGPTWALLRLPSVDRLRGADAEVDPTAYALLASVDDAEALGKVLDSVASRFNQYLRDQDKGKPGTKEADPPILALERLPAPHRGYQLTSPARLVPWLDDEVRPVILVGKSFVACASNLERAREALASESQAAAPWRPSGELTPAFACLPERLTFLAVGDHRDSPWPNAIAHLPSTVQVLSALLGIDADPEAAGAAELLAVIGIPRPGGFRMRIDPSKIPTADQIRPYLFPSVLAATGDDRGFRVIIREAFPFTCFGNEATVKSSMKWSNNQGLSKDLLLMLGLFD